MVINKNIFLDFDEYASNMMKWDLEFNQLTMGKFSGKICQLLLPNMIIQKYDISKSLKINGTVPQGYYTFSIGIVTHNKAIWRNKLIKSNVIAVYPKSAEIEAVSPDDFSTFELSISKNYLEKVAPYYNVEDIENYLEGDKHYKCDPQKLDQFKILLNGYLNKLELSKSHAFYLTKTIEEEVVSNLLKLLFSSSSEKQNHQTIRRTLAVNIVDEVLSKDDIGSLSVLDLCEKANVSQRTLEYAFRKKYNITPKQYLRIVRLNRVRKLLLDSINSQTNISDISNQYGFWHMGQFAKDYKNLFGELPSATITSKKTN